MQILSISPHLSLNRKDKQLDPGLFSYLTRFTLNSNIFNALGFFKAALFAPISDETFSFYEPFPSPAIDSLVIYFLIHFWFLLTTNCQQWWTFFFCTPIFLCLFPSCFDCPASIKKLQEQNESHQVSRTRMVEGMALALEKKDQVKVIYWTQQCIRLICEWSHV